MRCLRSVYLSPILLILFASSSHGQRDNDPMMLGSSFEISGQVQANNNKTIENVMIRIETASGALVDQGPADSMGRFRFGRLRHGQYRVSARASGFIATSQTVDLNRSSPRQFVLLQLVNESPTFRTGGLESARVVDARVPQSAVSALNSARAAFDKQKPKEAIEHLRTAISLYSDYYAAHYLLGEVYMSTTDWPKAEEALRQAVRIDPKSVSAKVSLAEVYRRQKKYEDGQKVLEEVLRLDNKSWEANYTLGRVYWELQNLPKAGLYLARTLELQPDFANAHLLAGNIFMRSGMLQNALFEYQEYLRLSPKGEFSAQAQALVDKLKASKP